MGEDMDKFAGRWEVTSTENMDEMLKAFDMEDAQRQVYAEMRFTMEYQRDGDDWVYTVEMPGGAKKTFTFTLGKEYDSSTLDGRPITSKVEAKDGKFVEIHHDKADPDLNCHMVREVVGDELIVCAKIKNITSVTKHKKL